MPVAVFWRKFAGIEANMDKNQCEVFARFTYADSLTYEELLDAEAALMARLEELLQGAGGEHLDFTPLGDMLRCQCAFETVDLENCRRIAAQVAAILPEGITGRLLALDKSLAGMHLFWLQKGAWEEAEWPVPATAPADAARHEVQVMVAEVPDGDAAAAPE